MRNVLRINQLYKAIRRTNITSSTYNMYSIAFVFISVIVNAMCDNTDGGKAPRITLNDGNTMPVLGYGTFPGFDENGQKKVKPGEVEEVVSWAFQAGYRMIDSAATYRNEDQVGAAVRASGIPRENIFVVTKLPADDQRDVVSQLRLSLSRLNLTYVDLYLIHKPFAFKPGFKEYDYVDYLDTWKGMEEAKKLGLTKSIGLSNFNSSQIDRILANCEIKPSVLQVEVNLRFNQDRLVDYCKTNGIVVMAYSPFAPMFYRKTPSINVDDPTLVGIAQKYKKTVTQITLKYLVQKGVAPIPKSTKKNRIEENIDIFDFDLSADDMITIGKFNEEKRTIDMSLWQDHPYYPFEQKEKQQ